MVNKQAGIYQCVIAYYLAIKTMFPGFLMVVCFSEISSTSDFILRLKIIFIESYTGREKM